MILGVLLANKLYMVIFKINKKITPCTKHSIFWGLAGSHPHADSGKNTGFLAPAYPHPPFTDTACGGADNGDAPAVVKSFEPYHTS